MDGGCAGQGSEYNHVVRTIDATTAVIRTIAGTAEVIPHQRNDPALQDPRHLNLPKICGLDYFGGRLFVPDWDGDLIVLESNEEREQWRRLPG